jgi:hypothetical protein
MNPGDRSIVACLLLTWYQSVGHWHSHLATDEVLEPVI